VLGSEFSGDALPVSATSTLKGKPQSWPEPDEFCRVPWSDLVATYGS